MESFRYTTAEKGKGKAQEIDDELPFSDRSIPSPHTSPLQGARLPMDRRFPVRPTAVSQSWSPAQPSRSLQTCTSPSQPPLSVLDPVPVSSQRIYRTVGSTDSIAESMTKEFKYDPDDKTPPKRRMKAMAEIVRSTSDGTGPSAISTLRSLPVAQTETTVFRLPIERRRAQQKRYQIQTQLGVEEGESSRSVASYMPATTTRSVDIEAQLTNTQTALQAAYDGVDAVYYRSALATGNWPHTDEEDSGEEGSDDGPVVYFLKSDAQRHFEESRRLTVLSEHTESSSSHGDNDRSQVGSSSIFGLGQSNLSALNIVEPGVGMFQNRPRRKMDSPAPDSQNLFADGDGVGAAGSSRVSAGPTFPVDALRCRPRPEVKLPVDADESHVSNTADSHRHPSAKGKNLDSQSHPLSTPPAPVVARAPSSSPVHLSPVQEIDSSRDSLLTSSSVSPPAPMQTDSEKQPSVAPPSVSAPSPGWRSWCRSILWYTLAWALPLTFLAAAMNNLATTRTFNEMPPEFFTAESKTLHSENQSSNLTIAWINRHTIGLDVSAIVNMTSMPSGLVSNNWSFLLDWSADGGMLSANAGAAGTAGEKVSAMPSPSFEEEFIRSLGFLGLFAVILWLVGLLSSSVSRCWHWREDDNVFWTRTLLHWFDEGRIWIDLILAAVFSAVIWAAVLRALLLVSV